MSNIANLGNFPHTIGNLDDRPNLTAAQMKAAFEQDVMTLWAKLAQAIPYINDILPASRLVDVVNNTSTDSGVPTAKAVYDAIADASLGGSAQQIIDDWLDAHPEATTTVTDGSITNAKLANSFVTPGVSDAYSSSATYAVGDYVYYNKTLYRCITAITTAEPWTEAHWTAVVLGEDVGELKSTLNDNTSGLFATILNGQISANTVNYGYYPFAGFDSIASGGLRILNHPGDSIVGGNIKKLYIKAYRETDAEVYILNIVSGIATVKSKIPIHIDPAKTEYDNWKDFFSPYCFAENDFIGLNVPTVGNCLYFKAATGQGSYSIGLVDYNIGETFSTEGTYNSYSISIGALIEKSYTTKELLNTIKYGKNGMTVSADVLNEGMSKYTPSYSVKTDYRYIARFEAANLGEVQIRHLNADNSWTRLSITPTKWSVKNGSNDEITLHTMENELKPEYMYVSIRIGKNHTAEINIGYPGDNYVFDDIAWIGDGLGGGTFSCISGEVTNLTFSVLFEQLNRPVWMFGDSYFHIDGGTTWMYHYLQDYDSVLICGYGGATTERDYTTFDTLSAICIPQEVIFCTGMNDGGDTDNTPNSNWMTWIEYVINRCKYSGIEPILATIPTVPTINHEAKNAWVRNSGYRYIDFAKAVGAQADGTWYTGMLSGDGVHPTNRGARVLYFQALIDAPEIACP